MSFELNGRVFLTNFEGFLENMDEWDKNVMFEMAKIDNITLTDLHIAVINEVRQYFIDFNATPKVRILIKMLKDKGYDIDSSKLASLFNDSAIKMASKLAGLKKPAQCI